MVLNICNPLATIQRISHSLEAFFKIEQNWENPKLFGTCFVQKDRIGHIFMYSSESTCIRK